jgi:hypothetical protein
MHEKDIELARLLIARDTELRERSAALQAELDGIQARVAEAKALSEQRDAYADILAKAADLLNRGDLAVEAPDTSADEARLAELQAQVGELEAQDRQYQELITALKERAPQLFDAATGALLSSPAEPSAAEAEAPAVTEEPQAKAEPPAAPEEDLPAEEAAASGAASEPEPEPAAEPEPEAASAPAAELPAEPPAPAEAAPSPEQPEAEAAPASPGGETDWDESVKLYVAGRGQAVPQQEEGMYSWGPPEEAASNGAATHQSEPDEPLTADELERFLQRFNLEQIQKETDEALGGEAAYVIDAASVLDNIPYYDRDIRGGPVRFIRDELLRDIDLLSRRLNGRVYLVLDQPHETEQKVSSKVSLRSLSPADKGRREAAEELFKVVLAEATKSGKPVSFVSGDAVLGGSLRSRRVHFFPLGDFFRT